MCTVHFNYMLTKVFQTKRTKNGCQVNKWYKLTFVNITDGANKCFVELCPSCYSKQEALHKKNCVHTWCGIGNVENIIHCYEGNNGLVQ